MDWNNQYNQNINPANPRIKYQLLLYKRREIEKKKKRKELIIRTLFIIIILITIYTGYYWYTTNYLQSKELDNPYTITVDKTTILQYDSLLTPYITFKVTIKPLNPKIDINTMDFTSDIQVIGDYKTEIKKLQGGVYNVKVVFNENQIPETVNVKIKDQTYKVSVIRDVTIELLSVKAPEETVVGEEFIVYLYIQTNTKINDWKIKTNVKFVGGKVTQSVSSSGIVYNFVLKLKPTKIVKDVLIKVYSKQYKVSKIIKLKTKIIQKHLSIRFSLENDKIIENPNDITQTKFSIILESNHHTKIFVEYKDSESLTVDVPNEFTIEPGQTVIQGIIYLKKSVDAIKKETVTIRVKDENGKLISEKLFTLTLIPSPQKIRISPTPMGLTPDNWIKLNLDFYTQLKNVNVEILNCTAQTDNSIKLDCKYDTTPIQLKYNKITSVPVLIDASRLIQEQWKGKITVTINLIFTSEGVQIGKGITIQTDLNLG